MKPRMHQLLLLVLWAHLEKLPMRHDSLVKFHCTFYFLSEIWMHAMEDIMKVMQASIIEEIKHEVDSWLIGGDEFSMSNSKTNDVNLGRVVHRIDTRTTVVEVMFLWVVLLTKKLNLFKLLPHDILLFNENDTIVFQVYFQSNGNAK